MKSGKALRAVGIGAGYFAPFHYDAWTRIEEVELAAICDIDEKRATHVAKQFGVPKVYTDWTEAINEERPDFVDIVSPPSMHAPICRYAAANGIHVVCQKPLTPEFSSSLDLVAYMNRSRVRFMVHENWRWQPWYRHIKEIADGQTLGVITHIHVLTRLGDGWGPEPYKRQPFFREYPRLLLYETGIHFIDTFRFLLGEVKTIYASLTRNNPLIKGEDAGIVQIQFQNGATALWDANRFAEGDMTDPRLTFGEIRVDFSGGHILVDGDARMYVKKLGEPKVEVSVEFDKGTFAGDCVYSLQRHFVDCLISGAPFESNGNDYLRSIKAVEAAYRSNETQTIVHMERE